jgi:hypothetical protein
MLSDIGLSAARTLEAWMSSTEVLRVSLSNIPATNGTSDRHQILVC